MKCRCSCCYTVQHYDIKKRFFAVIILTNIYYLLTQTPQKSGLERDAVTTDYKTETSAKRSCFIETLRSNDERKKVLSSDQTVLKNCLYKSSFCSPVKNDLISSAVVCQPSIREAVVHKSNEVKDTKLNSAAGMGPKARSQYIIKRSNVTPTRPLRLQTESFSCQDVCKKEKMAKQSVCDENGREFDCDQNGFSTVGRSGKLVSNQYNFISHLRNSDLVVSALEKSKTCTKNITKPALSASLEPNDFVNYNGGTKAHLSIPSDDRGYHSSVSMSPSDKFEQGQQPSKETLVCSENAALSESENSRGLYLLKSKFSESIQENEQSQSPQTPLDHFSDHKDKLKKRR